MFCCGALLTCEARRNEKVLGELGRAAGPTSTELLALERGGGVSERLVAAREVQAAVEAFQAETITDIELLRQLEAVGGAAGAEVQTLTGALVEAFEARRRAPSSRSATSRPPAARSGRSPMASRPRAAGSSASSAASTKATEDTGNAFLDLYNRVVGQSYVPDLVTEAGGWFDRLKSDMTTSTGEATSAVAEAFAGLDRQVSYRLGSMIAHNKLALTDFASFAQDVLGQILGGLIGAGINAGIGSLFAPATAGATFNPATATGPEVLHAGGIVGAPGNPRRGGVPWAAFLGADRYHRGGIAGLRPGEVPVIAMRGERITPAGQAAGSSMTVVIDDQRRGGEAIETRERRGAGGDRILEVTIRDTMSRSLARGEQDAAMAARFGLRPGLAGR